MRTKHASLDGDGENEDYIGSTYDWIYPNTNQVLNMTELVLNMTVFHPRYNRSTSNYGWMYTKYD